MDKKKVEDLAKSFSLSCKKLAKDKQLMRTIATPSIMVISLTVIDLVSNDPSKIFWAI